MTQPKNHNKYIKLSTGVSEYLMHAYTLFSHFKMVTKLAKSLFDAADIVILNRDNKDLYERYCNVLAISVTR